MSPASGFEALQEEMLLRAGTEKQRIEAEASAEIARIEASADAEIARLKDEAMEALERELEREAGQLRSEASLESRSRALEIKSRVVEQVFAAAEKEIDARARDPHVLTSLGAEAARQAGNDGGRVRLITSEANASSLSSLKNVEVLAKAGSSSGTMIAESPDGKRAVDNSLRTRLGRARKYLLPDLARILFED